MRKLVFVSMLALLSGCSEIYGDLEFAYSNNSAPKNLVKLAIQTFSVSSRNRTGIETYRGIASISLSSEGISLDPGAPFTNRVFIPAKEIAGCAMTCFGTDDQRIDFLLPNTGTDLMVKSSEILLSWCWENKKPMFSGKTKRGWLYDNEQLPPASEFQAQFNSREVFDKQKVQSCLGY